MIRFAGRDVEEAVQGAVLRDGRVDELLVGALVDDVEGLCAGRPTDRRRTADIAGRRTGNDRDRVP